MYSPIWIKPLFYKYEKLLCYELDLKALSNDGGGEL